MSAYIETRQDPALQEQNIIMCHKSNRLSALSALTLENIMFWQGSIHLGNGKYKLHYVATH